MSRLYAVPFAGTITNAGGDVDLFEFTPADDKPIRLRKLIFGQTSELGDAAEENLPFQVLVLPATATSGSGGSSVTPKPFDSVDAAAGFTAEVNNTTVATTSGTAVTAEDAAWNVRSSPYEWIAPDERFAPMARGSEVMVVRLSSGPADDISGRVTAVVEEI